MNRSLYTLLIVAAALLCACSHQEIHDFAPSDTPSGYLAVNLSWENAEDVGLSLTHFNIIVEGSNTTASAEFPTKQAVAQWLKQLPAGEYDVLVTAEMTQAAGYVLSGTTASLSDPASSPEQSWFGVAHVTIRANEITTAAFQLQRLMAFLSVNIRNVPDGVTLCLTADRVAGSVSLMEKGADGRWGRPAADSTAVTLRHHTAVATRSVTQATAFQSLLPTATGFDRALVGLDITRPDGDRLFCLFDMPRMESGHYYNIDITYRDLQAYMWCDVWHINDWTERVEIISGEAPLPLE